MLDMTISERLRALREEAGLDQVQAAKVADTTKQAVSQIENGRTKVPGGLYLFRWAKHYGVDLEWLITGVGAKRPRVKAKAEETPVEAAIQSQSQPQRITGQTIVSAYRDAIAKFESAGQGSARAFKPQADEDHAELLALAIIGRMDATEADSSIPVEVEVGRGSSRADRKGSGVVGEDRPAEAGRESGAEAGQRAKRKAGGSKRA